MIGMASSTKLEARTCAVAREHLIDHFRRESEDRARLFYADVVREHDTRLAVVLGCLAAVTFWTPSTCGDVSTSGRRSFPLELAIIF